MERMASKIVVPSINLPLFSMVKLIIYGKPVSHIVCAMPVASGSVGIIPAYKKSTSDLQNRSACHLGYGHFYLSFLIKI